MNSRFRQLVPFRGAWAALACVWLLLIGGGALDGRAAPRSGVVPTRAPQIRACDAQRDTPALRRLEAIRGTLPEKYRRRHNFAWAVAKIDGLEKVEYFAHSGVDRAKDLRGCTNATVRANISMRVKPERGRFEVLCVNRVDEIEGPGCFPRLSDTEYKIMEDMAARLPDSSVSGRVRIYTDLYPGASCRHVMGQFLTIYTNVQMQVLYRDPKRK